MELNQTVASYRACDQLLSLKVANLIGPHHSPADVVVYCHSNDQHGWLTGRCVCCECIGLYRSSCSQQIRHYVGNNGPLYVPLYLVTYYIHVDC